MYAYAQETLLAHSTMYSCPVVDDVMVKMRIPTNITTLCNNHVK